MKKQEPENYIEKSRVKTVGYLEKNKIQKGRCFRKGILNREKFQGKTNMLLNHKTINNDFCLISLSEIVEGGEQTEEKGREI